MILRILCFSLFILLSLSSIAQKDTLSIKIGDNSSDLPNYNSWAITYSPSAMANIYSGLQFGIEKALDSHRFVEFEAAYIPKLEGRTELYKSGFRLKLGYKRIKKETRLFAVTLYLRRSYHQHKEEVIRQNNFIQTIEYSRTKTLFGPTASFGFSQSISDRWGLESSFLFGPGIYYIRVYDFPDDAEIIRFNLFDGYSRTGNYFYPIIGISLKIKYLLGIH